MKWIKYEYVCGTNTNGSEILIKKRIGYSEANLVIAQTEAYNGEYTIEDDGKEYPSSAAIPVDTDMQGNRIVNLGDPIDDGDAVSKKFVDTKIDKKGISLGIGTDGLMYIFVDDEPTGIGIEYAAKSGDIVGYIDNQNNIVLSGALSNGVTYTAKYEMDNGDIIEIGTFNIDEHIYCEVIFLLTNCTSSNKESVAIKGQSYATKFTATDGNVMYSISVTMGGVDITDSVLIDDDSINIPNVTGDIVITAVAEEVKVAEPVTVDIALTDGIRIGSDGGDRTQAGYCATPHIDLTAIPKPCTIHLTKALWCHAGVQTSTMVRVYAKNTSGSALVADTTRTDVGSGYFTVVDNSGIGNDVTVTVTSGEVASIRFSGGWTISGVSDSNVSFAAANTKATLTYTPAS